MNEELQNALTELIKGAVDAKNFIIDELPEVVRQFLLWKMWASIAETFFGVVLAGFIACCVIWYWRRWDKIRENDWEISAIIFLVLIALLGGMIITLINLDWLQIWLAPKVYLIEYVAKMAK